ncbi:MAG TPA: EAL domain-containing protein [Gammaproteobacteria bacterium]|nr:EAL domain-containing protein [Gammaproteobacteria bacterium]
MNNKPYTLHKTLAFTILLTGIIGIALVIATDYTYRQLAFEQQRESIRQLIKIKSTDLLSKLMDRQKDLGFQLQGENEFLQAFNSEDKTELTYWLDQEFNRYYVTTGLIKLEKILIFDKDFRLAGFSERGLDIRNGENLPCSQLVDHVRSLPNAQRTKPGSQLCKYNDQPLSSTIVSIGSLKPEGYIQIITNPAHILTQIEPELGIPLKIHDLNDNLLHQSRDWPTETLGQNYLVSSYTIRKDNTPFMRVSGATDITAFINHLDTTRYKIIIGAIALTFLTLVVALIILHRALSPLNHLRHAADSSARGEFISVDEKGFSEITTPIAAFNVMVNKIQASIAKYQDEVELHKKTEKKLERAKEIAEQHARQAKKQSSFLHLTMQSIVDGVITTDIDGYIKSINPTAEQLTGWAEAEAKGKPLVQVMHALKEDTHKRIYDPTENIEHKTVLDTPVSAILIQQNSNIETPVEYIVAPMRDHEDEIAGIVIIIHDESVQRSLNRQLTFQATHDALTGLINRYEFERRLKNVISEQARDKSTNTLCYIDLDQFKLVNDTCGHTAGDELLKQITLLLQNNLGGTGTLARLGGDEFGLLLENSDVDEARKVTKRLLEIIQQFQFSWNESTFTIGASIGISAILDSTISCEEILSNADSACYLAKESGRNRVQIFTAEDNKLLTQQREMHWVSRINHALEENRFQLYFQEIMPLDSHEQSFLLHGEILLRMINKEGDIVSPANFLPAAERYNMITLIDEWVVEKSIQWLASQKDKVLISVNLSGMSLSNRDFLNFVVSKIKQHRVNPELLCFEITETAAISHLSTAIHFMNVLKRLGCSFALDDFGSGLSSFSYLTSLPVDYLKIDGAFVMDIDKDPMHYAMVKSINEVGQVMGIKTIAEYAASDSIIECLREVGVDNAQGYAVARPVPLASISVETAKPALVAVRNDRSTG